MEVVGGSEVWKGVQFMANLRYGFKVIQVDGVDTLSWVVTNTGEQSPSAHETEGFIRVFAPDFYAQLMTGELNPEDPNNLVIEIAKHLDKEAIGTTFVESSYSKQNVPYPKPKWEQMTPSTPEALYALNEALKPTRVAVPETTFVQPEGITVKSESKPEPEKQPEVPSQAEVVSDGELDEKGKETLYMVLDYLAGEKAIVDGVLTKAGITVAQTHLTPLKEQGKIPRAELASANFTLANTILTELVKGDTLNDEQRQFVKVTSEELTRKLLFNDEGEGW
jgi:hypothetical protein